MPLTGFNELKRQTIRDHICANDDSGLGESVVYRFKDGREAKFDAQVSFTKQNDVEKLTNLVIWDITVLIMKEYLDYQEPQLGDTIEVRDIRWNLGVATEEETKRRYGTETGIIEEGSSWWRVAFVAEHLTTKQARMNR